MYALRSEQRKSAAKGGEGEGAPAREAGVGHELRAAPDTLLVLLELVHQVLQARNKFCRKFLEENLILM